MKKILIISLFLFNHANSFAQKTDKTVQSLIEAEKKFIKKANKESIKESFIEIIAANCIVFKPSPILAEDFYSKNDVSGKRLWQPEYAMIAKSGDFGFTTGLYIDNDFEKKNYGHYLSIWKTNNHKKWQLILDAGVPHQQPFAPVPEVFFNPENDNYPKLIGALKIRMRADIIFSTDELLGKSLGKSGITSLLEFYDNSVRLYFPNYLPQYGKVAALDFVKTQKLSIISKPIAADRAFSGDLAYSYGEAVINNKGYYYVRIWKIDDEKKWNIIIDTYLNQTN